MLVSIAAWWFTCGVLVRIFGLRSDVEIITAFWFLVTGGSLILFQALRVWWNGRTT
jgi:hypothetical protein